MPSAPAADTMLLHQAQPAVSGQPAAGWPLRRYLLAMVLAVLLPLLAFAGVLLWYDVTHHYDIHRRGMLATVQALSLAVDREWATMQAMLQTLGTSRLLDTEDLHAFYDRCATEAARHPGAWIVLFAPSGQQVLNTLRPFGAALPNVFTAQAVQPAPRAGELPLASAETVRRALQTGQPVYSDLFLGLVSQRPTVTLEMPVLRQGRVVYVLSMAFPPDVFTRLLQAQDLPVDAISGIVDRRGMIIARSTKPEQFVGRSATTNTLTEVAASDTGWGPGRSQAQVPIYRAWTRSPVTGWTTILAITQASIAGPIRRSLVLWTGGAVFALGLGLGLALRVARRITVPLAALTRSADLVQRGQSFVMPPVAVQEVQSLYAALTVTADAVRQQASEREHRLIAEAETAERQRTAEALAEINAALRQAEVSQHLLAEVSALLAMADDLPTQLAQLAHLLVPTLADWCSIDLLQDDGRIHRLAVVHADPSKAALAEQLRQQYPLLAADAPHTLVRVLRTGQSWFDPAVSPERLRAEAREAAYWELEQALGFQSEMVVPLLARGRVLGTITCVLGAGTRCYSPADLTLAEELARRAAVAIENAQLYQAAQAARAALQQANAELERRVEERTAALHQAMAERQRLEREAQRAEHFTLLGRLAAGVSHEIRNPLGAIFLHVDLVAEELQQPSPDSLAVLAEALSEIKTNLTRLDDLVQDYLSLVRVGHIQPEVQDLGAAVQAWEAELQQEMAVRGVTLRLEGVTSLGAVAFHASTLRRALLNLVQNAVDAMPQGGTVTLAGQGTAAQVQLEVRDTGSGIPPEQLARIFEPLYTTKPGGTGLGLYIVQEIVAAHGGQVTVASAKGQGATFTIALPRAAKVASGPSAGAAPVDTSRGFC